MRVTLFWYMIVSPFVEFRPLLLGSHWAELSEWARLPSAEGLLSGRGPKEVCPASFAVVCKLVVGGTETPKGRRMRSRRPSAAGRRKGPEAVTEQETGYIMADTLQSKVVICTMAAEVHRNRSSIRAGMSAVRRAQIATVVACRKPLVRLLHQTRGQVGKASRISSKKRHE